MKINCPNCATQFSLPESVLGDFGKKLKCAKCGHKWFQPAPGAEEGPDLASEPPSEADAATAEEGSAAEDAGPGDMASDDDDLGDLDKELPEDDGELAEDPPAPEPPAAPPNPPAQMRAAPPPGAGKGSILDDGGDFLDFDDDEDEEERQAAAAIAAARAEAVEEEDYEPIAFKLPRAGERTERRDGAGKLLWSLVVLAILGGIASGGYAFRAELVARWPATVAVYDALGIPTQVPGYGLDIRNVMPERLRGTDGESLIVRGVLANASDQPLDVPMLKLSIYRGDKLVQQKLAAPPQDRLPPATTASFRIEFEDPDPLADRIAITFEARESPRAGG